MGLKGLKGLPGMGLGRIWVGWQKKMMFVVWG